MKKYCFLLLMTIFLIKTAVAQKDTAVYYLKNSGEIKMRNSQPFNFQMRPALPLAYRRR
jgi:hypothetical protein